jgi:hypothetical protein
MRDILQTWCQIQRTTSSLSNVVCGPGHIKCIYSSTYSGFIIQLNVSPPLLEIYRQFSVRYTANLVLIQSTTSRLHNVNCGPGHIQCIYSSAYSDFNVHLIISALLLEISRQFNARNTANIQPYTAYIVPFTQCVLWSRKYAMYLQLLIFRQQYSSERMCAAIGHIPTFRCALYCKFGVKYRAHGLVYAARTLIPYIYNVISIPLIQASIFNWTYMRCYWRYADIWMRVILQIWCHI